MLLSVVFTDIKDNNTTDFKYNNKTPSVFNVKVRDR